MPYSYDSFEGFAGAYDLAEETQKHITDVMKRYCDKVEGGEKITEPDFMEDMALASGLGEEDVRKMLHVLRQHPVWQRTVDELCDIWAAQNKNAPTLPGE
ncbi:hypothetical protein JQN58_20600 [Aneurinibacillus sp. BA2021]|nr:hypothetical protein [Aneurinibacillus sp. BA2021]